MNGTCDSCGKENLPLIDVAHHQEGNETVWHYCESCKLSHDVELETNKRLQELAAVDAQGANSPEVAAAIRSKVALEFINK